MITGEQIQAARAGDPKARESVMMWVYRLITPMICARVANQDQEDVRQRTLQRILKLLEEKAPNEPDRFRRWALVFARTVILEHWRERGLDIERFGNEFDVDAEPAPSPSPASRLHKSYLLRLLSSFLRRLPQHYRSALLHRFGGGGDTSFAEKRDIAKGTVRWLRHKARKRLTAMFRSRLGLEDHESLWMLGPASSPRS